MLLEMLVLTRQKDESIIIGNNIKITVVDVRNNGAHDDNIRLGITAPKRIPVHREEIYEAIQREKAQKHTAGNKAANSRISKNRAGIHKTGKMDKGDSFALKGGIGAGIPG